MNANEYESPQKLADYLKYLGGNETAYNAYFTWKENVVFEKKSFEIVPICDMCIQLNLENYSGIKKSVLNDTVDYWSSKENCLNDVKIV